MVCRKSLSFVALVAVVLAANSLPAAGETTKEKREATRRRREALQLTIDLVRASDAKVEDEANRLSNAVSLQQARLENARRVQLTAGRLVTQASNKITELETKLAQSKRRIVDTAIRAYVQPTTFGAPTPPLTAMGDYTRAITLTAYVQGRAADSVDQFKADKVDLQAAREQLVVERSKAADLANAEAAQAAILVKAQATKQAAHRELQRRIDDLRAESEDLAAQERELATLIQREAAALAAVRAKAVSDASAAARRTAERASRSRVPSARQPSSGAAPGSALAWPVRGPITSEFGARWGSFHAGIDIAPPSGTPIGAAQEGTVVFAGAYGAYGNFVAIDHGGGIATAYAHQSRLAVIKGDSVQRGDVIGYVGNSGRSTGPHLHFEVRLNGSAQNPRNYLG